jgi:N-acetylmuramoyl-L-alanine amidase
MTRQKIVILDNGHGKDTPGKRSPEGMLAKKGEVVFHEFEFNRDIVQRVSKFLIEAGIQYKILVPELSDVTLYERVQRVEKEFSNKSFDFFLISVHADAFEANKGTGWSAYTSIGETESDKIAEIFYNVAKKKLKKVKVNVTEMVDGKLKSIEKTFKFKFRSDDIDGDQDKEAKFYMLTKTPCPAVLTENLFYTNENDLQFLLSDDGRQVIAEIHFEAIKEYIG